LPIEGGYYCKFDFSISISEQAASRFANATAGLAENVTSGGRYLEKNIDFYLDDNLVDSLLISADLKGKETTQVAVSGPGYGANEAEAYGEAELNMRQLQTVLITGSLPFKLEIVKLDSISPLLGREFTQNIFIAAIAAAIAVGLIIFLRYRKGIIILPVMITVLSEIMIVLGIAALIRWNLDLASIAGIIAAIGTGVDDQILMVDESRGSKEYSIKERIKRAFRIILGAYVTSAVALLPLWWAGAGLLRGFAFTTLIGITIGVFITRPAFGDMIKQIIKD
jgi:preprotein translocase subunit SecD